jgi:ribosomal protein S18 acetylase RimI-like enzyme
MIEIRRAGAEDVDLVAPLFDAYRQFYRRPADLALARDFLAHRLTRGEAVVLLACEAGEARPVECGFAQVYPTWSSLACGPTWILSDLFVAVPFRRRGIARRLMEAAHRSARDAGALKVELDTAHDNTSAQALYEALGYERDLEFHHYMLSLA